MSGFSRRELGLAGLMAALALVLAMVGGAWAAKKYLITSPSQIKPSVLKKLKGPKGQPGAQGPAGSAGTPGPKGDTGATGPEGKAGKEGSPWTSGGTLPPGETEVGSWGWRHATEDITPEMVPISFGLPLSEAPDVVLLKSSETEAEGCPGIVDGLPTADPGTLCVYTALEFDIASIKFISPTPTLPFEEGAGQSGSVISLDPEGENPFAYGSWAVTAHEVP